MASERDSDDGDTGANRWLARGATAMAHADRRLSRTIDDLFLPDDARLTERERAVLSETLAAIVASIESDLRRQLARPVGLTAVAGNRSVFDRLVASGVLRDPDLMHELIARVRLDLLGEALPAVAADEPDTPALLTRLAASNDVAVAQAATAVLAVPPRWSHAGTDDLKRGSGLPAELQHKMAWWVAAAIRAESIDPAGDRALTDAAVRHLAHHDESSRPEAAAMRLVAVIDARPEERAALLLHAIGDRQVNLFVALIAAALPTDFAAARDIVLDRDGAIWIALRAIALDRATIARTGVVLAPDVEVFADQLDAIMAIAPDAARASLARYLLPPDLRAAIGEIEGVR